MSVLKKPNAGCLMRGPTAPSATLQPRVHGYIIEVHMNTASTGPSVISSATKTDINNKVTAVQNYNNAHTRNVPSMVLSNGTVNFTFSGTDVTAADVGQYIVSGETVPGVTIATVNTVAHTGTLSVAAFGASSGDVIIGQPQGLRMRIECGQYASNWVYTNTGTTSVNLQDNVNPPNKFNVWKWWLTGAQTLLGVNSLGPIMYCYGQFISALSSLVLNSGLSVDDTPEIREITVGACMVKTAEVYFRYAGSGNNNTNYTNGGFTSAGDHLGLLQQIALHVAAFPDTICMVDLNSYDTVTDNDGFASSLAFTQDTEDYAMGVGAYSTLIAPGLCITNASLQTSGNAALYTDMQNRGPLGTGDATRNKKVAVSFQTLQEPTVNAGNLAAVLARAVSFGAMSCEIISAGSGDTDANILTAINSGAPSYDTQLMTNFPSGTALVGYPWQGVAPVQPGQPNEFPSNCTGPGIR